MALTPSTMLPLGTKAPDFMLPDAVSGKFFSLAEIKSDVATVIIFMCNHCPYVKHIQNKLVEVVKKYQAQGVQFIGISSNDVEKYPADSPEKMREEAHAHDYTFPYLYDETQDVAKVYQAACTPDLYVFDRDLLCVYRGCFDDSTPGNGVMVTGKDLSAALDAVIAHEAVDSEQRPSVGCNIKWKK